MNKMTSFSEMAIPLTLLFVSSAICKSIEIGNETVLNIEGINVSNIEHEVNIQSNEIQGT